MQLLHQIFIQLIVFTVFFVILFYYYVPVKKTEMQNTSGLINDKNKLNSNDGEFSVPVIYIWCIVVKIEDHNSVLLKKFKIFLKSLLYHSKCSLSLNIMTDDKSKEFVEYVINDIVNRMEYKLHETVFYDIKNASMKIKPITEIMQSHFSSVPGTYYSDSLFYISLGLDKIAPPSHHKVILVDVDIKFEASIAKLYEYFSDFTSNTLFAFAPELSPVYHHILWKWKQTHPNSTFGEPSYKGFSGLNSGVVLMNLDLIRSSEEYHECITRNYVDSITAKYMFKGHLGDQDFYTLLAMEKPHLIKILPCTWNKQLCEWWKHHGYADVFDDFARCDGAINVYHGNCNTAIPVT